MTAAARKLGLDISLVLLHGEKGPVLQGNYLLYRADGGGRRRSSTCHRSSCSSPISTQGRESCARPVGGPTSSRRWAPEPVAGCDRIRQGGARARCSSGETAGLDPDWLVLCGANMTPAGTGCSASRRWGARTRLINMAPIKWTEDRAVDIARDRQRRGGAAGHRHPARRRPRSRATTSISASATAW